MRGAWFRGEILTQEERTRFLKSSSTNQYWQNLRGEGGDSKPEVQCSETGRWYEIPPTSTPDLNFEPRFSRASETKNRSNIFATSSSPVLKFLQVGESFTGSMSTKLAFSKKDWKKPLFLSTLGCAPQTSHRDRVRFKSPPPLPPEKGHGKCLQRPNPPKRRSYQNKDRKYSPPRRLNCYSYVVT
jgi:hypothetical protein